MDRDRYNILIGWHLGIQKSLLKDLDRDKLDKTNQELVKT